MICRCEDVTVNALWWRVAVFTCLHWKGFGISWVWQCFLGPVSKKSDFLRVSLHSLCLEWYRTFLVCWIYPIDRRSNSREHWPRAPSSIVFGNYIPISPLVFQIERHVRSYDMRKLRDQCALSQSNAGKGGWEFLDIPEIAPFWSTFPGDRKQKTSTGASDVPELWGKALESC